MSFLDSSRWSGVMQRDELHFEILNAEQHHIDILEWLEASNYKFSHGKTSIESVDQDVIIFEDKSNAMEFKLRFYTDGKLRLK